MTSADAPDTLRQQAAQLERAGRLDEAIATHRRLLALRPLWADGWYNLGQTQWKARQFEAALATYAHALGLGITQPEEVHLNRAVILARDLGRSDEAVHELERALALNPRYGPALLNLGNVCEQRGERERARTLYQQVLALDPRQALALSRLPNLQTLQDPADPLIGQLQQALQVPGRHPAERADLGFGLGKALDDVARHDEAFAAYRAANAASREAGGPATRYDAAAHERHVDRLIATFPRPAVQGPDTAGHPPPIFICGMFRSGSTLVEQVLGAHPQITAGGELDLLPSLARQHLLPGAPWPVLDEPATLSALAEQYRAGVAQRFPGATQVTDKRPDNFLHIGLIKALFPTARIVFTRREPLDNCLAVWFLHLSRSMPYALDLLDTAHWYRQHLRLLRHWQVVYADDVFVFDYDRFVRDPEPVAQQLLAFCGLPWDPACLRFHDRRSVVQTASLWQVRQPLHTRSSGRWRHYAAHLGPLRAALGEDLHTPSSTQPVEKISTSPEAGF